ncbi:ATP-binding cassette domain-containing protein [Lutibacter sp. TH_r2]|uniref:sulfate/molybdate ABC transporter ATP-binding protein n=1 Tax=Lutibacter sp. TH_r2 TaxID=3082083 RepID=UPI0029537A70|nr:ATP-binding cassette domain-containing protein [Lutibacter sp. TH_r2]MDV7187028.1 ATP-binding cassette domain-containing protein [Lutibacter sp. TH_r2]
MIELNFHKKLTAATGEMLLDINTSIKKGSLVTLYGKSGVGKTTILRILGGLLKPEKGTILVNKTTWFNSDEKINLKPQKRNVGFVFQDYALFPNMTVKENLEFALEKNQSTKIVKELIELIELGELQNRKPTTLSGGQKQRVALARALVKKPSILMLDEPLSALDYEIRFKLQQYILQVHQEFNLTTILISHDISEILRMSDHIIEIENGKIIREGKPTEVFNIKEFNAKFQFTGTIIHIEKQDFLYILTVHIGKDLVKIVADESEGSQLTIGDKILVSAKAFNPIINKIN